MVGRFAALGCEISQLTAKFTSTFCHLAVSHIEITWFF